MHGDARQHSPARGPRESRPCEKGLERSGRTIRLEDAEDLVTGDGLDLGDTVRVTEDDTDLGGSQTLAGQLEDVVVDLVGRDLQPPRGGALVGEGRTGDSLVGVVPTGRGGQRLSARGPPRANSHASHFELVEAAEPASKTRG